MACRWLLSRQSRGVDSLVGTVHGRGPFVLLVCAVVALAGGAAWSQSATVNVDHPAGISSLFVEEPGTGNDPASRLQLWSLDGDPRTPDDDNLAITGDRNPLSGDVDAFPCITTISIDNTDLNATDQVLDDLSNIQDGGGREFWPLEPIARTRDIVYTMLVGIDGGPDVALETIEVHAELVLLRDTVMLEYTLKNLGTTTHLVGLRHFIDCTFGGGAQDGTSIILSDGSILTEEAAFPGADNLPLPDGWVSFDSQSAPVVVLRGTISGGEVDDPGLATMSAGIPDSVEFGQRLNCGRDAQWTFTPNPSATLVGEDWGYATRWDEAALAPGASRRYVTYYGLGSSVSDFTPPYVLAGYAPFELVVHNGDDPTTPIVEDAYLGDGVGNGGWEVSGYCDNFGSGSIRDARVTISLPNGFELDTTQGSQSRTVLLGTIARGVQAGASWTVRTTDDVLPGIHEVRITGPLGKSVRRKVSVPALPTLPQGHLDPLSGLSMVTVPFNFQVTDAEHVFTSLGSLQGANAALVRWDPVAQIYRFFPDNFLTNVEPGLAYWLVNRLLLPIQFPNDRTALPTNAPYPVQLDTGWNQIGSPFLSTIRLDQAIVVGSDGIDRTAIEAFNAGLIVPTLYKYDPTLRDYTFVTAMGDAVFEPYVGYWLLARRPVTIVMPTPTLIPFTQNATPVAAAADDGWRATLLVKGLGLTRTGREIGMAASANDGIDLSDVPSPPEVTTETGARLSAYFIREDAGRADRYVADIRGDAPRKQSWTFVVDTNAVRQDVSVSWPDLSAMPPNLAATLEDLQTGRVRSMRCTTHYAYDSGQGGQRQFRITVAERPAHALAQVTAFRHHATAAGVQMAFSLGADAAVDVTVRNLAGRVIKRVWEGRTVTAGEVDVLWTGQSENGLVVPNGSYVVEVVAQAQETGERAGVIRAIRYYR